MNLVYYVENCGKLATAFFKKTQLPNYDSPTKDV